MGQMLKGGGVERLYLRAVIGRGKEERREEKRRKGFRVTILCINLRRS